MIGDQNQDNFIGILYDKNLKYPSFPFNPDKNYPELNYDFDPQPNNVLFENLRTLLYKMGYDAGNYNSENWNPFQFFIKKGDLVLLKPNFVIDNPINPFSVITHASLIRFLIDYVNIAVGSKGKIIIADTPQTNSDIEKIKKYTQIENLIKYLADKNFPVFFHDLRLEFTDIKKGIWCKRTKLKGDPAGFRIIDLKDKSFLHELEIKDDNIFYGADYNRRIVNYYHNKNQNLYCISQTALNADVIISIPKLKTHKKAGITLNLKNMIGINIHKNFLPHYKDKLPHEGGDAYPPMNSFLNYLRFQRFLLRKLFLKKYDSKMGIFFFRLFSKKNIIENGIVKIFFPKFNELYTIIDGNWKGNDTIWRTILDLNFIIKYADKNGNIQKQPQRKFFSLIDGIIGGEKEGPLNPIKKDLGVLIMGTNFIINDLCAVKLMGFNYKKIPLMRNAIIYENLCDKLLNEINHVKIISNNNNLNEIKLKDLKLNFNFSPPKGWKTIKL